MKPLLIAIPTAIIATFLTLYGVYNFMPLSLIDQSSENLGSTITTIASTDTLKDSRAVINTNFTNLNTDKMEISTTTLPNLTTLVNLTTVGTISSGAWNGTAIPVSKGGTGTTTILANGVLIGNGASGITTVATGTSGQVLGLVEGVPRWQSSSLDTTLDYSWTGSSTFTKLAVDGEAIYASGNELNVLDGVSANVTAVNLNALTDSTGTTSLHTHPMNTGVFSTSTKSGPMPIAHGLGVVPKLVKVTVYCGSNVHYGSFSVGTALSATSENSITYSDNGTNVVIANNAGSIFVCDDNTAAYDSSAVITTIDATNVTYQFTIGASASLVMLWEVYR